MNVTALPFIVAGIACAIWPYRISRFGEQLDAIGSKRRWGEVEPADWNVALTKYGGIVMAAFGILLFFLA